MPRGQYDRMAARERRTVEAAISHGAVEAVHTEILPNGDAVLVRVPKQFTVVPTSLILDQHQQPVTQAAYDALVTQRDRLLRLCQTHGLMVG